MKRIIICLALLFGCAFTSFYSADRAQRSYDDISARIEELTSVMDTLDNQTLVLKMSELAEFWELEEDVLAHFVRHSHLDSITVSMSRLSTLAAFGDTGGLSAELASIRRQLEHVAESERIILENLF